MHCSIVGRYASRSSWSCIFTRSFPTHYYCFPLCCSSIASSTSLSSPDSRCSSVFVSRRRFGTTIASRKASSSSSSPPTPGEASSIASAWVSPAQRVEAYISHKVVSPFMKTLKRVVALADERLVTERKRIFHRQPVSSASLSERLAHQRQNRVPTDIRVSPNKEIVSFAWPTRRRDLRPSTEASLSSSSSTTGTESAHLDSSSHSSQRTHHTTSSASLSNTASLSSAALKESAPSLVREEAHSSTSVALAEFLRVYTPSTDGSFCTDRVVYGKRGVRITGLTPIGNYALRISFSDGHDAGIYTYEYLFHLTGQEHKYRLMREYIRSLRAQRKVRDPPRRKPSTRFKD